MWSSASTKVAKVKERLKIDDIKSTADVTAMWKAVSKEVVDDTAKMALADALAESGDSDLASVIDWCIKMKRWPKHRKAYSYDKRKYWFWAPSSLQFDPKNIGNGLPRPVHEFVKHKNDTIQEAIETLRDGLVTIREIGPKWRS